MKDPNDKGQYRSVYSAVWDDPEFQAFTSTAKLIFFCLRTSASCNFPCIYSHYHSMIHERLPDLIDEVIDKGIHDLIDAGWIKYERPVLWIVKGLLNEPNYVPKNEKQRSGIMRILKGFPKLKIVNDFREYYGFIGEGNDPLFEKIHEGIDEDIDEGIEAGKGRGKGKGKRQDIGASADASAPDLLPEEMTKSWNEEIDIQGNGCKISKILRLTPARKKKCHQRIVSLKLNPKKWIEVMAKIHDNDFLSGRTPSKEHSGWKASFDWVIKSDDVILKIIEGAYEQ